jgi:hypothetical protein
MLNHFPAVAGFTLTKKGAARSTSLPVVEFGTPWLFGYECVAVALHVVVRGEDVGLLLCDELTDGKREILVEGVGVGLLGLVFSLFGGLEEGVVAAAQFGFKVSPDAVDGPGSCTGLFDVVYTVLMENLLEVAAEAGALKRFGEEVALEGVVFQMFTDVGKAFLAVEEGADEGVESALHLVLLPCVCWHDETSILGIVLVRLEQGPSAVRDSPLPTASRRNRENPAPLPTGSKDRRVKFGSAVNMKE